MLYPMYKLYIYCVSIIILAISITGCSTTRYLAEDEKLYTGADIKLESEEKIENRRAVERELEEVVRPRPNDKLFGLFRHRLWFYSVAGEEADRGLRGWIKNRLGQPPVLVEHANPENTSILMSNRLQNLGYFNAKVAYEISERKRTANILYTVQPHHPYRINDIHFPEPDMELTEEIRNTKDETLLREGEIFNLSDLRAERERIDAVLKNRGFFYFNVDFMRFRADSTIGNNQVDLFLTVREDAPRAAQYRYRIGNIYLYPDYILDRDVISLPSDTIYTDGMYIIQHENRFRPEIFDRYVFFNTGAYYNRQDHLLTINRLMGLGMFKFGNVRFRETDNVEQPSIDAHIYLTPVTERSLRAEFRAVSKSNDLAGPGLSMGYRNRNLFRGAELFTADINTSFETQLGGGQRGLALYQIGVETELQIPRIISPIPIFTRESLFVPRTRIRFGYDILHRVDWLRINSFSTRFGYVWMSGRYVRQELNPIGLNYFRSTVISSELEDDLTENPARRRSLESQFIIGTTYSLFFNNQTDAQRRNHVYFNFNVDLAGNTINLLQSLFRSGAATEDEPFTMFGIPYSQYARADFDLRYYLRTGEKSQIVTRLIAGVGVPYGNSTSMPYVKQYFSGGSNSIRAFPARSLGPGILPPPEDDGFITDRTGDIRLEANLEYRFPFVSILKGALFIDAGNIWMVRQDETREGVVFDFNAFAGELAVGTGFGLRLDASFFVIRFDIAFPLRKPYLPRGERWVTDEIDFGNSQWRRDNLAFNIAIGYPF